MLIAIVSALRQLAGVEATREDEKSKKELQEIKQKFIRELKKHPLLERIGPENIWDDLQKHIRDQIRRRNKAASDDDERRLQEIRREFIEGVKRSLSLSNLEAEKIWNNIQDDIRAEIRLHPGEWLSD
jgi:hypothetical protein